MLLNTLGIEPPQVVYDPFVGCGTTPIVSAARGLGTYSCDISSLAALTTRMKLNPPTYQHLESVLSIAKETYLQDLIQRFVNKSLSEKFPQYILELLQFVLSSTLLRIGWHKGNALQLEEFQVELLLLIEEMIADTQAVSSLETSHFVRCCDFYTVEPGEVASFASGQVALISSPPFFGSNTNPAKERLARLMGQSVDVSTPRLQEHYSKVMEMTTLLCSIEQDTENYKQVLAYLSFLEQIAKHAADLQCRNVAIEMGPKIVQDELLEFDQFIAQRLTTYGYSILLFETSQLGSETVTLICARNTTETKKYNV